MVLAKKTVGQVLDEAAERFPERNALVHVDRGLRYSYRELREQVDALARGLLALGLEPCA